MPSHAAMLTLKGKREERAALPNERVDDAETRHWLRDKHADSGSESRRPERALGNDDIIGKFYLGEERQTGI